MGYLTRKFLQFYWSRAKKKDDKRIAAQTPPPGIAQTRDIPYLPDQNPMHLLDIYYPEGTGGLLPLIIDIHGGGWMYGDKELNKHYNLSLAARGFAVANMNYRLLPETDLRGQVGDVFACLRWLEAHGREHHCDSGRAFLTGDSAGGHLAALTLCITLNPELQKLYGVTPASFPIRAAAISHGVCKLRGRSLSGFRMVDREMFRLWFGNNPEENPLYGRAGFEEAARGLKLPPVMLISSEADQYHHQSLDMERYLRGTGGVYRTKFWKREQGKQLGHVFHILYPEWTESRETNGEMLAFFQEF
ncbi:MAG: alpha/beta hydrolase [Treponema sp.]|nr:alpha/beta hydrolase [Treponema sp.]